MGRMPNDKARNPNECQSSNDKAGLTASVGRYLIDCLSV
jgi:hypothetical protein